MNGRGRQTCRKIALLAGGLLLCGALPPAADAATGQNWRGIYDLVMAWVNFFILAAVLVKVLRQPLGRYLQERRDEMKDALEALESEKARMETAIASLESELQDRSRRAADLHRRIVEQGEAERSAIMDAARQEAARRIDKARRQVEARQRDARRTLRNELIDAAVAGAVTVLPQHMTPQIQQALTTRFLNSLTPRKP